MLYPLGGAGGTGGVEDKKRILGIHPFYRAVRRLGCGRLMPPDIPIRIHLHLGVGPAHDKTGLHGVALVLAHGKRCIGTALEGNRLGAAHDPVAGHKDLTKGVHDSVGQGFGGKTAKDDGMDGPDAGTGQHGHGQFRDHGHVDGHPVSLCHPSFFKGIGKLTHLFVELAVGNLQVLAHIVALPDQGRLVAPGLKMPVQAVVGDIGLGIFEPFDKYRALGDGIVKIPNLVPFLLPVKFFGNLPPESFRILDRFLVHGLVLLHGLNPGIFTILVRGMKFVVAHKDLLFIFNNWTCSSFLQELQRG